MTGFFHMVDGGERIQAEGEFFNHSSYGRQFRMNSYQISEPDSKDSILKYLSSGVIKGIRAGLAERIVKKFGEDTFRIMGEEPERLQEVKGISLKKAGEIGEEFAAKAGMRRAILFLQKYGIGNVLGVRIYKCYGERLYTVISENPYRMTEEVRGVGFRTADEIAQKAGIERHSDYRIRSGILYCLSLSLNDGNVYLPEEEFLGKAAALLTVEEADVKSQLDNLCMERRVIRKQKGEEIRIYPANFYRMESQCARMLRDLDLEENVSEEEALSDIRQIELSSDLSLDEAQREAVVGAIRHGIFLMTGGPGTGKTTTIRVLLQYFLSKGMDVMLSAPTGRAAKRMSESAGMEARTIHRMLEVSGEAIDDENSAESDSGGSMAFGRNSENPLETDVVIVDEMSMVDIRLFYSLLSAIQAGTKLVMVGDSHQLPSVGPGSVLKDLIQSACFHMVSLKKIFRQAEESDIVMNAHAVLQGTGLRLDNKSRDFFFLNRANAEEIIEGIIYLVSKKLPPYVKATPYEIQVLTPMRKGTLGVDSLNEKLQAALNPSSKGKREISFKKGILREGDKIMQIRNNYRQEWEQTVPGDPLRVSGTGVFNGDLGVVVSINPEGASVRVQFDDGRESIYGTGELSDLDLAYAITIHKSQGSEYPAVVMPLLTGPELLMNRNLLYTGITRAKKCVTIIGSRNTVYQMVGNTTEQKRYTGLSDKLKELCGGIMPEDRETEEY